MWGADYSNRFQKSFSKLTTETKDEAIKAVDTLLRSDHPERMGRQKTGSWKSYFAWELGRDCRIIYRPRRTDNKVEFERICSHKEYKA